MALIDPEPADDETPGIHARAEDAIDTGAARLVGDLFMEDRVAIFRLADARPDTGALEGRVPARARRAFERYRQRIVRLSAGIDLAHLAAPRPCHRRLARMRGNHDGTA